MERGWLKSWRKILDSPIWRRKNKNAFIVFSFLLHSATHQARKHAVGPLLVDMEPGDHVSSLRKIAENCSLTVKEVRVVIRNLIQTQTISTKNVTHGGAHHATVFSIVNWNIYQGSAGNEGTPEGTQKGTRRAHGGHNNKKKEEIDIAANSVRPLLDLYVSLFEEKVGKKPVINFGKDGKHLKGLLKVLGEEGVRDILHRFFSSSDPFITKAGYTIGVLHSVANKLIAEASKETTSGGYEGTAGRKLERVT